MPKSRTWATTRNDLQDAKQSEVQAGNTVTMMASGVLGGGALQQSMAAGAQAGRTSPRGVCVVIIMTSCVGAVGNDERAHACSASRRFMSLHVYSYSTKLLIVCTVFRVFESSINLLIIRL